MYRVMAITLVLAGVVLADDAPVREPKSASALAAIHKAAAAEKTAREEYDSALFKARRTELEELQTAMKTATRATDLDEANAIAGKVKQVKSELAETASPSIAAEMKGRWKTHHLNNESLTWSITDQKITIDGREGTAVPEVKGNVMMMKWTNLGWINRLTFVGDKFIYEGWGPGHSVDGPPDDSTVGYRIATDK
jgi:polyribonucleotide nucleotidyltransferase